MAHDPRVTILPPGQPMNKAVGSRRADMLARDAAPFGNTWVARVRWRSAERMVDAYRGFIRSVRETEEELDALEHTMLIRKHTALFMEHEAEQWHQHEADQRQAMYARSDSDLKDELLRSKIREWEREREEEEERAFHEEWKQQKRAPQTKHQTTSSHHGSQAEQEADAQFDGIAQAAKARHKVQRSIDEMLEGRSMEQASSGEQMIFEQMRADVEQMIRDRGWL